MAKEVELEQQVDDLKLDRAHKQIIIYNIRRELQHYKFHCRLYALTTTILSAALIYVTCIK